MYNHNLFPPIGTTWFRLDPHVIWDNHWFPNSKITWRVDAYIYTVNARPDRHFKNNGGLIFVVLVHRALCLHWTGRIRFGVIFPAEKVELVKHLPAQDSHTQDGSRRTYSINFKQTMQMFQNNGNEPISFSAGYEDRFSLNDFEYLPSDQNGEGSHIWSVKPDQDRSGSSASDYTLSALSVYRLSSLEEIPFTFLFDDDSRFEKSVNINAVFKA
ncbi:hypothetical protein ONZ45_g6627 [Pleurotus djamor]|nr:hypothetical protein ONZ45_g6627 [Pleurotus djamor]